MIVRLLLLFVYYFLLFKHKFKQILVNVMDWLKSVIHKRTPSDITRDGKLLKKVPLHMGLLVAEDDISMLTLSKILFWCLCYGIPQISVYDYEGKLKLQEKELKHKTELLLKMSNSYASHSSISFVTDYSHTTLPESTAKLHVCLLSAENGKQWVVDKTKLLCDMVLKNDAKLSDVDTHYVDAFMKEQSGMHDPDLILQFGPGRSLTGYLPWQVRLTEIIVLPSHHYLPYSAFYEALSSYGTIQQRFGK